jgi:hypothetical protein
MTKKLMQNNSLLMEKGNAKQSPRQGSLAVGYLHGYAVLGYGN